MKVLRTIVRLSITGLDRPLDVAPVDGSVVLVDLKRLHCSNDAIGQKWIHFYSTRVDTHDMKSAKVTEMRGVMYVAHKRGTPNELLIHVAVEIKTTTTVATINSAIK